MVSDVPVGALRYIEGMMKVITRDSKVGFLPCHKLERSGDWAIEFLTLVPRT